MIVKSLESTLTPEESSVRLCQNFDFVFTKNWGPGDENSFVMPSKASHKRLGQFL